MNSLEENYKEIMKTTYIKNVFKSDEKLNAISISTLKLMVNWVTKCHEKTPVFAIWPPFEYVSFLFEILQCPI